MKSSILRPALEKPSTLLPFVVIALTLSIFALAIWLVSQDLRAKIREQIAGRDGETLHQIARLQQSIDAAQADEEDSTDQVTFLLKISRLPQLKDTMGIRLFDANGRFVDSFPPYVGEADLVSRDLERIKEFKPVSHFHPKVRLSDQFLTLPDASAKESAPVSILEIIIPLYAKNERGLAGAAQYLLDGRSIASEFKSLDHNLAFQGAIACLAGGLIIILALGWAFYRLQHSNRLLADRTSALLRANHDLTMAAKSSALGAVTAHLIHELKSPLFGLECFMAARGENGTKESTPDWEMAVSSTRRMQSLIGDVVRVLREENGFSHYEVSFEELGTLISGRVGPLAQRSGVHFQTELRVPGMLSNRLANLVILILDILIQNAIQASAERKTVKLRILKTQDGVDCEVHDGGPGFPSHLRPALFTPCHSGKKGGNGIGLAIAKQLSNHLQASLELRTSNASGCIFVLTLPDKILVEAQEPRSETLAR